MKRVALVLLTFDGVETFYCGVGASTQYLLAALPAVRHSLLGERVDLTVHILYSEIPHNAFGRSAVIAQRSRLLCDVAAATLVPLGHGGLVPNPFGVPASWPITCRQASVYIRGLLKQYNRVLVVAQDTPFAGLSRTLPLDRSGRLRLV